jgi:hypothetical protein
MIIYDLLSECFIKNAGIKNTGMQINKPFITPDAENDEKIINFFLSAFAL